MNLPKQFEYKMKSLLKDEYDDFIESFNAKSYKGVRVNTSKITHESFIKAYNYTLRQIPWCEDGYYVDCEKGAKLGKHPYHHCGLYYIQEPSAMIPVEVLSVSSNDKILDICAAPGGKSTQIANKLNGTGLLVTNDISPKRVKSLAKNIKIMGFTNCIVLNEKPENLSNNFVGYFDKILVDAPCSGEGMFKRDAVSIKKWSENSCYEYSDMQKSILKYVPKMLKEGGSIVYSTCTFSPEENEGTINWFLKEFPEFYVDKINNMDMLDSGQPEWINADDSLKYAKRALPHKIEGDGHFVVLLKKQTSNSIMHYKEQPSNADSNIVEGFLKFQEDFLNKKQNGKFVSKQSKLYLLPKETPDLSNLRVEYMGLLLGEYKNNNFIPSNELILSLTTTDLKQYINLDSNNINAIKYLKGETLISPKDYNYNKWTGIFIDSHPAGWVKASGSILKNCYNKSWRMQ
ncbi:RsmB/NOP family class I SAM-dependent RNA methyltransferase [Clostridiaceae bacterium M8S5]|nr:RsmB/NOP family class I SAM-dependent RNA methyltransferase [Clostridiaceae bacterium M8S5]